MGSTCRVAVATSSPPPQSSCPTRHACHSTKLPGRTAWPAVAVRLLRTTCFASPGSGSARPAGPVTARPRRTTCCCSSLRRRLELSSSNRRSTGCCCLRSMIKRCRAAATSQRHGGQSSRYDANTMLMQLALQPTALLGRPVSKRVHVAYINYTHEKIPVENFAAT